MIIKSKETCPRPAVGDVVNVIVGQPGPDVAVCEVLQVLEDRFKVYEFNTDVEFEVEFVNDKQWWYDNTYVVTNDMWLKFQFAVENFVPPGDVHPVIAKAMLDALICKRDELSKELWDMNVKRAKRGKHY